MAVAASFSIISVNMFKSLTRKSSVPDGRYPLSCPRGLPLPWTAQAVPPGKSMGPEAGKGPGARDWGILKKCQKSGNFK